MANSISDVTVDISVEDVVNPAAFGGICLYARPDSSSGEWGKPLPYAEAYSYDEAKKIISKTDNEGGLMKARASLTFKTLTPNKTTPKATLNALNTNYTFTANTYDIESNNKTINGVSYPLRVKAITDNNGINIKLESGHANIGVACAGSTKGKEVTVMLKDSSGNVIDSYIVTGDEAEYVILNAESVSSSEILTLCSTSDVGGALHIYAIEQLYISDKGYIMLESVEKVFMQDNPPEKIGLLSCAIDKITDYLSCDWRYLIEIGEDDKISELAKKIENCGAKKVLGIITAIDSVGSSGLDYSRYKREVYPAIKDLERTFVFAVRKNDDTYNNVAAALVAKTNNKAVGSFTYKNQTLKGMLADTEVTKAQLVEYHSYGCNAYVHKAGYDVTSEGKLVNGEYIDILDAKDWIVTQIEYQLQQALIINDKIPYNNNGIALLESIVANVLQDAFNNGIIAEDDNGKASYTVNFARRTDTKASDREKRQYMEGKFTFDLAGAIHSVTVNGTINI